MKTSISIKDTDKGFKQLKKELGLIKNCFVTVGIHKDAEPYPNGTSVVEVAATNEFGTDKAGKNKNIVIPERSFLRSTFDENLDNVKKLRQDNFQKIITFQMTVKKALDQIGFYFANLVKNKIEKFTTPPNAPSTQAAKALKKGMAREGKRKKDITAQGMTVAGYNDPLVDTRHMKNSVTFESHLE
jgi:hypothetical protein